MLTITHPYKVLILFLTLLTAPLLQALNHDYDDELKDNSDYEYTILDKSCAWSDKIATLAFIQQPDINAKIKKHAELINNDEALSILSAELNQKYAQKDLSKHVLFLIEYLLKKDGFCQLQSLNFLRKHATYLQPASSHQPTPIPSQREKNINLAVGGAGILIGMVIMDVFRVSIKGKLSQKGRKKSKWRQNKKGEEQERGK